MPDAHVHGPRASVEHDVRDYHGIRGRVVVDGLGEIPGNRDLDLGKRGRHLIKLLPPPAFMFHRAWASSTPL